MGFSAMTIWSIAALAAIAVSASGCTVPQQKPAPDPYSPWYHILHPIACHVGKSCQQWVEPGLMVKD